MHTYLTHKMQKYTKEVKKMRIVAGKYKHRLIKAPKGMQTRPTGDKVKESLFNILQNRILDATCLDLFAGSGNLGLEGLSRGAHFCYFVDCQHEAIKVIKENVRSLNVETQVKILQMDYYQALKTLNVAFDVIFLDPPYRYHVFHQIMDLLLSQQQLKEHAVIFYECDAKKEINYEAYLFQFEVKTYLYGQTKLYMFIKKEIEKSN